MTIFLVYFLTLLVFCYKVGSAHKTSVYYGNWKIYERGFPLCDIPFEKIDRLYYVFNDPSNGKCKFADIDLDLNKAQSIDGRCNSQLQPDSDPLKGNMYQLKVIKQRFPNLKVFFVIGGAGYTSSMHDYVMTKDIKKMKGFVKSCVDMYNNYSFAFDGIDIDYEYPCLTDDQACKEITPVDNEKGLFVNFISEFRNQLGSSRLISLATSPDYKKIDALDFSKLNSLVDIYNIMTYDFTSGSNDIYTGHHTQPYINGDDPLYYRKYLSTELAGKYYISSGADPSKINIGVAFYGRGFYIQRGTSNIGPFLSDQGEISFGTWETGMIDYNDIVQNYKNANNSFFDEESMAPYILDSSKGLFITYDDDKSIYEKIKILSKQGYDGIFAYELTGDDSNFTLLGAMIQVYNEGLQQRIEIFFLLILILGLIL